MDSGKIGSFRMLTMINEKLFTSSFPVVLLPTKVDWALDGWMNVAELVLLKVSCNIRLRLGTATAGEGQRNDRSQLYEGLSLGL